MKQPIAATEPGSAAFPRWLKSVIGITVFLAILATILYSTGFFQRGFATGNTRRANYKPLPPAQLMAINIEERDWPRAEENCRKLLAEDQFNAHAIYNLGYILQRQDRLDEAAEQYRKSSEFLDYRADSLYHLACIDALQDRPEEALAKLEAALQDGFLSGDGIAVDPDFAALREDPQFKRLVRMESGNREQRAARKK